MNVAPEKRYYRFGVIDAGERKVEINYTDSGEDEMVGFPEYAVYLYVYAAYLTVW
ncbi:MAG TPA: hypothetical protein VK826_20995 [Bacteroidia bacterium]|nr:hypothetical protein [Bacteroidia bacterium]